MKCRCGVVFERPGYGRPLCPACTARWRTRRAATASMPKCPCGAVISLARQCDGKTNCTRCETERKQHLRQGALDRFADRLLRRGL